jgi:hypothetical protein
MMLASSTNITKEMIQENPRRRKNQKMEEKQYRKL